MKTEHSLFTYRLPPIACLLFILFPLLSFQNSSHSITKQGMCGSSFTVPKGKIWKIKRVLVNNGNYNIVVGSVKYEKELNSGEKIHVPFYTPEADMLGEEQGSFTYIFEIEERDVR